MISKNLLSELKKIITVVKQRVILDKNEEKFISTNKKIWSKDKIKVSDKVILLDLFHWNPFINFWSIIVNVFAKRFDAKIKYFYTDFYQTRSSVHSFFIRKLKILYASFNVEEGVCEYNFNLTKEENNKYSKMFNKLNLNNLVNFKRDNIQIGDLIYDTYLRTTPAHTIREKNKRVKLVFFRANKIYDELKKYFSKNKVVCVIPSHTYYINYGIIVRMAIKRNIPVVKITYKNRGNSLFHLLRVEKNGSEEYPYYNYKKIFNTFSNKKKKIAFAQGKRLIDDRLSGNFDKNLPYMPISGFNKIKKNNENLKSKKRKIFLFPHCYLDAPHRYRSMIFDDFYKRMKFFLEQSKKLTKYQWYYKPHPNELKWSRDIHKTILKDYPSVIRLKKNYSHKSVIKSKPALIITNHGTIAHEYAACKIPVLNTGDNPHINYKFCLHAKSKRDIINILNNLDNIKNRINFNIKEIYEYMYMRYIHFLYLNDEKKFIKDKYFSYKDIRVNNTSKNLLKTTYLLPKERKNIEKYIELWFKNNL